MRFAPILSATLLVAALISAVSCSPCRCPAQELSSRDVPSFARDEIKRRGDFVERINTEGELVGQSPDARPLAPPADDSHKWFITLVTQPGCTPCDRLKHDFARNPNLSPFVDVENHKRSWAHYNVYSSADLTQQWRFKSLRLSAFPTLIIQPPRDGSYGDPKTVVVQITGYDGDAARMALRIRNAILAYAQAHNQRREADVEQEETEQTETDLEDLSVHSVDSCREASAIGQQAPFDVPGPNPLVPQIDFPRPFQPQPQPAPYPQPTGPLFPNLPNILPNIAPLQPTFDVGSLLTMLITSMLGGFLTPTNIMLVVGGLMILREIRKARGKQPIIPDTIWDRGMDFLKDLLNTSPPAKPVESKHDDAADAK